MNPGEQNQDPYTQPGPIVSSPNSGTTQAPVARAQASSSASRYFGGRSKFSGSSSRNLAASRAVAANPNTPQFFSEAMVAETPIQAERPRRSKLPLFIGLGVVAFIGLIVGIVMLANSAIKTSNEQLAKDFNKLANLVIYNRDLDTLPSENNISDGIAMYGYGNSYSNNKAYFDKIEEKAKVLIESAKKSGLSNSDKEKYIIYGEVIIAWIREISIGVDQKEVMDKYYSSNKDVAVKFAKEKYEILTNSSNADIKKAGENYLEIVLRLISLAEKVKEDGQRIDTMNSETQEKYQSQIDELNNTGEQLSNEANSLINKEFKNRIEKTWEYSQSLEVKK